MGAWLCAEPSHQRKGPLMRPFLNSADAELLEVLADQASQFKHGDLGFAKHGFELVVGIDVALVHAVLQAMLLDVRPHLADHFCARHSSVADHSSQSGARCHGFHECSVRGAFFSGRLFGGYFFRWCFFSNNFLRCYFFSGGCFFAAGFLAATFFAGAAFFAATFLAGAAFFAAGFLAGAFFAVAMIDSF
jgi:hypothetical protein